MPPIRDGTSFMLTVQLQTGCAALHRSATERPRIGAMRAMQRPVQPGSPIRSAGQHRHCISAHSKDSRSKKFFRCAEFSRSSALERRRCAAVRHKQEKEKMEYLTNKKIKEKLSRIAFAPHGIELTSAKNYSNFYNKGGNVFHIHGEGNEKVTRKTFANWLRTIPEKENIFTVFKLLIMRGMTRLNLTNQDFPFTSIKEEIDYNLKLTGLNKIDAIYFAEDNSNYSIQLIQKTIHQLIENGLVNYIGLFNWSLDRIKEYNIFQKKKNQEGVSFIITTELSILKPNFGIYDGYIEIDEEFENYLVEEGLLLIAWTTNFNQSPLKGNKVDIKSMKNTRERKRWNSEHNLKLSDKINQYCELKRIRPHQLNISFVKNRKYDYFDFNI